MKTTFMNVSRRVIGALAVLLGISSCQSSQSEMTFEQEGDSLAVIHITNPTRYLLLPIEEQTPESQVCIASGSGPVGMDVGLSRAKVDYFVPYVKASSCSELHKSFILPSSFFNSLVSVFSSWFSVLNRLLVVLALSICCL